MARALRLSIVGGLVALALAPGAMAAGPATAFSAAGTSAQQPGPYATTPVVPGPCALAVSGSSGDATSTGAAGGKLGAGTLTASGPGASISGPSTCGPAASLQFDVTAVTGTAPNLTLAVTVTSGDTVAPGTTGTISIADGGGTAPDTITFAIGAEAGTLGAGAVTAATYADVEIGGSVADATGLTPYATTATSVRTSPLSDQYGPCTLALAGVETQVASGAPVELGGGAFQSLAGSPTFANSASECGATPGASPIAVTALSGTTASVTNGSVTFTPSAPAPAVSFGIGAYNDTFEGPLTNNGSYEQRAEVVVGTLTPTATAGGESGSGGATGGRGTGVGGGAAPCSVPVEINADGHWTAFDARGHEHDVHVAVTADCDVGRDGDVYLHHADVQFDFDGLGVDCHAQTDGTRHDVTTVSAEGNLAEIEGVCLHAPFRVTLTDLGHGQGNHSDLIAASVGTLAQLPGAPTRLVVHIDYS